MEVTFSQKHFKKKKKKKKPLGVPTAAQQVMDPALSLSQCGFNLWPSTVG